MTLPKAFQVDIRKHPDFEKVKTAYLKGQITDAENIELLRKMKFSMVDPVYLDYVKNRQQKELRLMFA
jgi:hypothetical protein